MNVDEMIRSAQHDDHDAWASIFDASYPSVVNSVKLKPALRRVYDETDIANEAFHNLAASRDRLNFATLDDLIAYLVAEVEAIVAARQRP